LQSSGELLLGRICAQIVSAEPVAQSSSSLPNTIHRPDLCCIAQVIACALCPPSSEIKIRLGVDSLSCALLSFFDAMQSQLDSLSALFELATCLGKEHRLAQHSEAMLSGFVPHFPSHFLYPVSSHLYP
jgi:hypothetical protein